MFKINNGDTVWGNFLFKRKEQNLLNPLTVASLEKAVKRLLALKSCKLVSKIAWYFVAK